MLDKLKQYIDGLAEDDFKTLTSLVVQKWLATGQQEVLVKSPGSTQLIGTIISTYARMRICDQYKEDPSADPAAGSV